MALKQPKSLLDQASFVLGTVIGKQALLITEKINTESGSIRTKENIDLKLNIKKLAEFYNATIPQSLHNALTYHTLKYIAGKSFETTDDDFNVFDLVLRNHVTKFSFGDWPKEMHSILHINLSKLGNLKFLYLDLQHMRNENLNYILNGIKEMKQLESFKCNHCTNDIITVLCNNCCHLINLDFWSSYDRVTDISVPSILKLQNLKKLNISAGISREGQKQLLLGLPHLKVWNGTWNRNLTWVLREIGDKILTSLWNVKCRSYCEDDVTNLIKICPSVIKLQIENDKSNKLLDLSNVANLKHLTSLCAKCDFYKSNILTILETRGYQLTELDLSCDNIAVRTLCMIDISCPNLITFSLNCVSFNDEEVEFPTNNGKVFQNLEYFSSSIHAFQHNITPCLIFFLRNCMKIKEVEFIHAQSFYDSDIDEILSCNPLVNLQKLFLDVHKLTVQSVYKLLTSCKQLRWLGYVAQWQTITESQLEELKNYVHAKNLNIDFVKNISSCFTNNCPTAMLGTGQCWSHFSKSYVYCR